MQTLMATKSSRVAGGQDRISGLSDELLETILNRLHSAADAARTSVLSRRWRSVWTRIPDLIFLNDVASPDAVDAAMAAHSAPAIDRLAVALADMSRPVSAARAAAWLRFAAPRTPREVHLVLPPKQPPAREEDVVFEDLEVPLFPTTEFLNVNLVYDFRLRLPVAEASVFENLRVLCISRCAASGADLSRVVSTQCPSLLSLDLSLLDADGDLSFRSDTLERLSLGVVGDNLRLEVTAPSLEWLQVHGCNPAEARITAPKLTEVEWDDVYDPALHIFHGTGRRLHRLAVTQWVWYQVPPLLQRFDVVDELSLHLLVLPVSLSLVDRAL
ncbi:hypothetical protein PR202_gb21183 [Eleusine coracana subsp. coracana]|uniref:F-box domain-containing protein n=1 Tax=Eleusine coracana subsp. coracana TaxID=191504 RepID=A0AAV5FDB0_ELECO|nr:hypothetical protein PR202_gb21183 [Eleusine coracana subsp. coracana]